MPRPAVGMFTAPQPTIALRYKGINLAEGGVLVIVELFSRNRSASGAGIDQRRQHCRRYADQWRNPTGHQQAGYRRLRQLRPHYPVGLMP